jgi:hypothetical protein
MPDAETTRKRSRSPSDSDAQQQSKRLNTGDEQPSRVKAEEDQVSAASSPVATAPDASAAVVKGESEDTPETAPGAPAIGSIHMRCLIVTQDASIIIGKAGAHVNEIREKSGAKVMVSESLPGNPERILNVSGPLDAVSKVVLVPTHSNFVLTRFPGLWPHRPSHQRRAIRPAFSTGKPCCDHQVHDPQLADGLRYRQGRL